MIERSDPCLVERLSVFASGAAIFSGAIGLSVLAGWTFQVAVLVSWLGRTPMAPNAAGCVVLASAALWFLRNNDSHSFKAAQTRAARMAAAVATLGGLLTLAEHLFTSDLGIDRLLLVMPLAPQMAGARILMSPVASGFFLLLGPALLLIDWRTRRGDWPAQFLSLGATVCAAFGLFGLILGPGISSITMAWPAVSSYFLLSFGLVCSRAPWALGGLLTGQSTGARLSRRAVPGAALVLIIVGLTISKPLLTESHFTWIEVGLLAVFSMVLLVGFVAWMASIIERGDAERRKLEAALDIGKEQMDRLMDRIEEPESEALLRRKVKTGFAVAVLLTGLLGLLSWRIAQQAAEDAGWVAHTHEVMTTLEATLRHLIDVETGGRGFALTGHEPYLEPYESGRYAAGRDLQILHLLLVDNPAQQGRLDTLEEEASSRIEAAKELVALRRKTGTVPKELQLEQGKQIMDATRSTIEHMEDGEKQLLEQRTRHSRATQSFNISVIGLGSVLGVVFLSIAGITVNREIGISARARSQVSALNADLERRVAQRTEALGESEGRLAGVIQSAMDAILTVDEQQHIVLFNAAAEKMFRCPAAEALGQAITRFIPQRFHAAHAGHINKFADTGVTNRAMGPRNVLWALRADGQEFQIEASISQVVAGGKKLFTVILRDVTERVKADEVRERLASVVDSSDDAIISKDLKGTINAWNSGAERIFGYPASEAMGKPMLMLFPPDHVTEESDILARIRRGESVEHFEAVRVRKDGRKIDASVTISPIRDSGGAIVGASTIARDITERNLAEEELRQSNARRRFALETAKLGEWELDLTTLQATRSLRHDAIFGYESPLPEWSFDIFLRHVHADDRESVGEYFQSCARTGKRWEFECRIVCASGDIRWIWACGDHYRDSSGKASHMFGIVEDITDRKRTEEGLREQAQIMDSAQVFVRDMESRIVFWPRGVEKLYGFSSEEALGILSHDLFHTQFPERLETIEKRLFETGMWEGELVHLKRDGGTIVVSSAWILHRDSQGKPVRILETNIDITERKRAAEALGAQALELSRYAEALGDSEQALQTQTLMLQSVLDSMSEGLVVADENGKFIIWNPAADRIVGLGAADVPSGEWNKHYGVFLPDTVTPFPPEQNPLLRAIHGEVCSAEMFLRNAELTEGVWIDSSASPLKNKDNVARGAVIAFRDITQRKKDEQKIRKLNDELELRVVERTAQLEAANKELEAFSYSVSHDLRAPLRHIGGFSKMLVEEFGSKLDPTAKHYLDRIQSGTQKMGLLVDELLNLARVGRQALKLQPTKLTPIVREVIAMLQPESEGRLVDWVVADLPVAECDPVLVKQVFQNLLANALKFTRPRATSDVSPQAGMLTPTTAFIEIGYKEENGQVVFMVRDNGIGFDMKYVDKLFGVFQRLHRAQDFEGTGIGLATVQRIVQKHGGRVWAEGELGKGATFSFTLGTAKQVELKSNIATAGGRL